MSSPVLRFYFDLISHNAYLAWTRIHRLAEDHGRAVEPVPVLFAGLLAAHGQLGPAEIRPKAIWMLKDVLRKARRLGIPLAPPAGHPFNSLPALRACCLELGPSVRRQLVDRLFRAAWAESRNVSDPKVVAEIGGSLGLDSRQVAARIRDQDVKDRLRRQTDEAIEAGVFGVPTVEVDGELFWGFDDLPHIELFLAGRDPLAGADLAPWLAVQPLAWRREAPPR